jgi:large subunit ribosomal protein L24
MKKKFSKHWIKSKQTRKKRKYRANAPLNIRRKLVSSNLSKELRGKYKRRNFPLRKGDTIKIMKGEFKGKKGKIASLDLKKTKAVIEGIQRTKKDGTKVNVIFDPSNLQIQELNLDDKQRIKSIEKNIKQAKETKPKEKEEQKK